MPSSPRHRAPAALSGGFGATSDDLYRMASHWWRTATTTLTTRARADWDQSGQRACRADAELARRGDGNTPRRLATAPEAEPDPAPALPGQEVATDAVPDLSGSAAPAGPSDVAARRRNLGIAG